MPVQFSVSEETLKDILKAIGVAVVTLSIKHLYSGGKKFYAYYEREKNIEYTLVMKKGTLIRAMLFLGAFNIVISVATILVTRFFL